MLKNVFTKSKDVASNLDLASFFAGRAGFVVPYIGVLVWSAWIFLNVLYGAGRPPWMTAFVMAVMWMVVPLGLRAADQLHAGPKTRAAGLLRVLVLPLAAITSLAFLTGPGIISAALTLPWLAFCGWAACVGVIRFLSRSDVTPDSLARDTSLIALAGGAFCLFLSRAGITPYELSERRMAFAAAWGMAMVYFGPLAADRFLAGRRRWHPVVFHLARRTAKDLSDFHRKQEALPVAIAPGLVTRDLPPGFRWDEWSAPVESFEDSCEALWNWAGHTEAGVAVSPARPRIAVGETFVFGIPFGPLSITGACRVTGIINESDVYGFVFSTLDHHAWCAEQSLMLSNIEGEAKVTATAIWAPTVVGSKAIPRVTRFLLARHIKGIISCIAEAEEAQLHSRMHEIVDSLIAPKTYRPAVAPVEPEIIEEALRPKTGAEILGEFDDGLVEFGAKV